MWVHTNRAKSRRDGGLEVCAASIINEVTITRDPELPPRSQKFKLIHETGKLGAGMAERATAGPV